MLDTQRSEGVYTKQQRIAEIARQRPQERLTALNHYLDIDWLAEAYQRVRRKGAPGVDGQTVADYGKELERNLPDLLNRAKSGRYQAPPVKRVHIPKGNGETRPIGMPTTEDKILQRAVVIFKRFEKYGLKLHPEKTQLVAFGRPGSRGPEGQEAEEPGTFDFLGLTHYWGKARKGYWVIKRKTAASRLKRSLKAVGDWCREHRHLGLREQHGTLVKKLTGHYAYYGLTGNAPSLNQMRTGVIRLWRKWVRRRSQGAHTIRTERLNRLLAGHLMLPYVRVVHSIYRANP